MDIAHILGKQEHLSCSLCNLTLVRFSGGFFSPSVIMPTLLCLYGSQKGRQGKVCFCVLHRIGSDTTNCFLKHACYHHSKNYLKQCGAITAFLRAPEGVVIHMGDFWVVELNNSCL